MIWVCNVLSELKVTGLYPVDVFYDSSSTIQIASNLVIHEKTKHIEIDFHLVRGKVSTFIINTINIHTSNYFVDIFTKDLSISLHHVLCEKLCLVEMFWL